MKTIEELRREADALLKQADALEECAKLGKLPVGFSIDYNGWEGYHEVKFNGEYLDFEYTSIEAYNNCWEAYNTAKKIVNHEESFWNKFSETLYDITIYLKHKDGTISGPFKVETTTRCNYYFVDEEGNSGEPYTSFQLIDFKWCDASKIQFDVETGLQK